MKTIKSSTVIWQSAVDDHPWNSYVQLYFRINSALPEAVQSMLKIDYQLKNDEHCICTRKALVFYIVRVMEQRHSEHKMPLWVRIA